LENRTGFLEGDNSTGKRKKRPKAKVVGQQRRTRAEEMGETEGRESANNTMWGTSGNQCKEKKFWERTHRIRGKKEQKGEVVKVSIIIPNSKSSKKRKGKGGIALHVNLFVVFVFGRERELPLF